VQISGTGSEGRHCDKISHYFIAFRQFAKYLHMHCGIRCDAILTAPRPEPRKYSTDTSDAVGAVREASMRADEDEEDWTEKRDRNIHAVVADHALSLRRRLTYWAETLMQPRKP
jgi:hypothetical protein